MEEWNIVKYRKTKKKHYSGEQGSAEIEACNNARASSVPNNWYVMQL